MIRKMEAVMKIVSNAEMLAMPSGTVFSFLGEDSGPHGELLTTPYIKEETLFHSDGTPFDFCIVNLLPDIGWSGIRHMTVGSRDGRFADDATYLVWDVAETRALANALVEKGDVRRHGCDNVPIASATFDIDPGYLSNGELVLVPKTQVTA